MSFFIAEAAAQTATETTASPQAGIFNIVLLVGLFAFMYFMIIRPQRKRQKEHEELTSNIKKGDEVVMNSGMLGVVVDVNDAYVTLKVADNVELKFQKVAVHAVVPKGTIKSI